MRYYTIDECSRIYHVSTRTLDRWRQSGDGPAFVRLGPRKIAYREADVEEWAAQRTFKHLGEERSRSQK